MMEEIPASKTVVLHASEDALVPMTSRILGRLGYQIVMPEAFDELRASNSELEADLLLVDERRLATIGIEADSSVDSTKPSPPIILLCGRNGATGADQRIVGSVKRPAGLHDLYRLMQQVFEETPRSTPRVPIQLAARCRSKDERWDGYVISLSENGCLIQTLDPILLGEIVHVEFAIPEVGPIEIEAEAAYQLLPATGLVFHGVEPASRDMLNRYVTRTILERAA